MATIKEGDKVTWAWGKGTASGIVQSIFTEKTTRTIDGTEVVRQGTEDNPALYIRNDDGNNVLKTSSEVKKAS